MDELAKGYEFSLTGPAADRTVAECRACVRGWGLALPEVRPLVLDFGLGDFRRIGLVEFWIANETAAGYCGKYLFVFDGQQCPLHHHETKTETFFVVKGRVHMQCGSSETDLEPGAVLRVAPGRQHGFSGLGPALLLELSTPCVIDDNVFADPRIPIGRRTKAESRR
ncbi:MAG: D-lyxose/D-mannose family sugar isomerase [Kiritimatiellaeota bacterium]|nr:D-lyxose/D-mannose family sugar isomerase [Kiritimatiellota bacterium]